MCLQLAMIFRSPRLELTASRYILSHLDNPRFESARVTMHRVPDKQSSIAIFTDDPIPRPNRLLSNDRIWHGRTIAEDEARRLLRRILPCRRAPVADSPSRD